MSCFLAFFIPRGSWSWGCGRLLLDSHNQPHQHPGDCSGGAQENMQTSLHDNPAPFTALGNCTMLSAPCTNCVFQSATPVHLKIFKIWLDKAIGNLDLMSKLDLAGRWAMISAATWSESSQDSSHSMTGLTHCLQSLWTWVRQLLLQLEYFSKHLEHALLISFNVS